MVMKTMPSGLAVLKANIQQKIDIYEDMDTDLSLLAFCMTGLECTAASAGLGLHS